MSKLKALFATLLIALAGFVGYAVIAGDTAKAGETVECGDNAIIRCGAMTASQLKSKYADNSRGLKKIYSYYNIDASDIAKSGSAKIGYVHTNGNVTVDGKVVATDAVTVGRSASLGGSKVNANGWTVYQGPNRLKSTLSAFVFFNSDGTFKSAVLRVCGNPVKAKKVVKPVYSCDLLSAEKITRTDYKFITNATAKNGASITGYSYDFGDGTTVSAGASTQHSYAKAGTYTAKVSVKIKVDGSTKTVTSDKCTVKIVVQPEQIQVCDLTTDTVITINKDDFDSSKHTTDLSKCERITVCDTSTKQIITISKNDMKDTYTTDLSKCQVIPVTPELPHTGVGEVLGGGLGAGALTLAGYYYFASRRVL